MASVKIPSTVIFAANAGGRGDSLDSAFELLVRQRTEILVSYKARLEEANVKLLDLAVTDPLTGLYPAQVRRDPGPGSKARTALRPRIAGGHRSGLLQIR